MGKPAKLRNEADQRLAAKLADEGLSRREIADMMGKTKAQVYQLVKLGQRQRDMPSNKY